MRVDPRFVKARTQFASCFAREAKDQGIAGPEISKLFNCLPLVIQNADCFQDALTGLWRYDLGTPPICLQSGHEIIGADLQFPQVRVLVKAIHLADKYLSRECVTSFANRLAHRKKHPEVLAEFQPLMHRLDLTGIRNEVPGAGQKTIDWLIPEPGKQPLLLEVKSRLVDLIESLESLEFAQSLGVEEIPTPRHDPAVMLRSAVEEFDFRSPLEALQCVWIASHLKQEITETGATFTQLTQGRIHVAIFGGWDRKVSMIGAAPDILAEVARRLNVSLTENFFFSRDAS